MGHLKWCQDPWKIILSENTNGDINTLCCVSHRFTPTYFCAFPTTDNSPSHYQLLTLLMFKKSHTSDLFFKANLEIHNLKF